MQNEDKNLRILKLSDLSGKGRNQFDIRPDTTELAEIAAELDILVLKKLRFSGEVSPENKKDWRLSAKLGASVQQSCVITNEPVTTRVDIPVTRMFQRDCGAEKTSGELEFDGNDEVEQLGSEIDLDAVMREALALALPDYPRAVGAKLEESAFAAPGITPLTHEDTKPFASLAALRDKLAK